MVLLNQNFKKFPGSYLFSQVAQRKAAFLAANPGTPLISMGIGDVTRPLPAGVVRAMEKAASELGRAETFQGYPPAQGQDFLLQRIAEACYAGLKVEADEIFISDGAKSDCGGMLDLFGPGTVVAVCDPVYPAYVDAAVISGFAGSYDPQLGRWTDILYLPCTAENGYVPALPTGRADVVYLCFPNNPTGAAATREQLQPWVDWANATGAVLLFDAAYEAFITSPGVPHSIYELPGAQTCAIELRSFSKTAGFTGVRCAWAVVPRTLMRDGQSLHDAWLRRQSTKFNGVSYITQRGAEAVYSPEGLAGVRDTLAYYRQNAALIRRALESGGLSCSGGTDSPYVWLTLPKGLTSWAAFDRILDKAHVITTPGSGFGRCGEGFLRLTAFGTPEDSRTAAQRIAEVLC